MLSLIPLLPLAGFAVNAAFGRRLPRAVSGGLASAAVIAAFAVAAVQVWALAGLPAAERVLTETVYTWIASGAFSVDVTLRLDPLSAVMVLVVTGIGALIHVYSTAYMHEETGPEYARYFAYLNLFVFFMLLLVLGANFLVLFVGWEGVGLCSYLLIGFYYRKKSAGDAGKKAFVVNRVGDYAFVLGVLLAVTTFGTLDFQAIAAQATALPPETTVGVLTLTTLLLFVGATGKSAQIPLYTWLPDAMEGPTPVSALIHAATMVTAGVYLIARNAALFEAAPITLGVVAVIGAATAIFAATIAIAQHDIKRVLAYSTVSQLGYMFLALGVGAFGAGIFHLFTHAFFKALLFLGAGAVITALHHEQDIRRMGGLRTALPLTYWTFLVGAVAIAGVPPLAGFFSKDEILFYTFYNGRHWLWAIGVATSLLTATYMFRLVFLTFHGRYRGGEVHPEESGGGHGGGGGHVQPDSGAAGHREWRDAPPAMAIALVVLALGSVTAGFLGVPHALGGHNQLGEWLHPALAAGAHVGEGVAAATDEAAMIALERTLMAVSVLVALVGIGVAFLCFVRRPELADAAAGRFPGVYRLLANKYYVDEIYDAAFVHPIRRAAETALWQGVDARIVDGAVNGAGRLVAALAAVLRLAQTGSVRTYAASTFLGVVVILGYYLWR